jgi:hypothetical protein
MTDKNKKVMVWINFNVTPAVKYPRIKMKFVKPRTRWEPFIYAMTAAVRAGRLKVSVIPLK